MPINKKPQIDGLKEIESACKAVKGGQDLYKSATGLLQTLGYSSPLTLRLDVATFAGLKEQFSIPDAAMKSDKVLDNEWLRAEFLMQVGTDEIAGTHSLFTPGLDDKAYGSFLFFAIELSQPAYTRSQLVAITREVNKPFNNPAILLFHYGQKLTLAIIERRLHKLKPNQDVLQKVTLIKDINLKQPHRAHLNILEKLSLQNTPVKTFEELLLAWKTVLNIRELNDAFYKDLSTWYYYAINHIKLPVRPAYIKTDADNIKAFTVRLICRTIFSWFLKERGLIDKNLLELYDVLEAPKGLLEGESTKAFLKQNSYYRAILQNVFFAALNTPMDARTGKKAYYGKPYLPASFDYEGFAKIPFLNGGLFDRLEEDNYNERIEDGPLKVPNELFYGKELIVTEGKKTKTTQGLNRILSQYVCGTPQSLDRLRVFVN